MQRRAVLGFNTRAGRLTPSWQRRREPESSEVCFLLVETLSSARNWIANQVSVQDMQRPNHEPRQGLRGAWALWPRRRPVVVGAAGFGMDAGDPAVSAAFGILSGHTSTAKSRWRMEEGGWNRKMGGVSVST
jgi:hypothetical protein